MPINRSVGLKAKPSKPVAEVLRPVAAKYGLRLSELVARLVSERHGVPGPPSRPQAQRCLLGPSLPPLSAKRAVAGVMGGRRGADTAPVCGFSTQQALGRTLPPPSCFPPCGGNAYCFLVPWSCPLGFGLVFETWGFGPRETKKRNK